MLRAVNMQLTGQQNQQLRLQQQQQQQDEGSLGRSMPNVSKQPLVAPDEAAAGAAAEAEGDGGGGTAADVEDDGAHRSGLEGGARAQPAPPSLRSGCYVCGSGSADSGDIFVGLMNEGGADGCCGVDGDFATELRCVRQRL